MPTSSFVPSGPFSRQTWQAIEALPGRALATLGRLGSYLGSEKAAQDYTNLLRGGGAVRPPMPGLPANYKQTELAAGAAAESFRPGAGFPGQQRVYASPAAERAYQSEKSRVAQMTAQNPDLQRYEDARLKAVAPGATPEQVQSAEDLGMRIWAEKYGKTLAPKVKPGQAGYDVIQGVLNAGTMGAPLDLPFNPSSVLSTEPVPTAVPYGSTTPATLPASAALAANAFANAQPGMFQRYRDQSALEVSPLGTATPMGSLNYGGSVQPIGASVIDESFRGDKARQLAEMFKNAMLTGNR